MLSKFEQALSLLSVKPSLTGSSMLVRLRAGIVGLLGVVAAVGLGLVAYVAQQGWPGVFSSPLPEGPEAPLVRNDTISPPPLVRRDPVAIAGQSGRRDRGPERGPAPAAHPTSDLTGSRQVGEPAPPVAPPDRPDDVSAPAPPPADTPAPSAPAPASPAVQSPPSESKSVPVAAEPDDFSPGGSGKSKSKKSRGRPSQVQAPPPPVEKDDEEVANEYKDPGEGGYEEDKGYDKDDGGDYYDHDRGRRGKSDWAGD